jgi:hypothetical protein
MAMNTTTKSALEMLRSLSPDFFTHLRGASARAGLPGEEKFGVGAFFVLMSRVRPHPLRLVIQETTEGGARYLLRSVAKLLETGSIRDVFSETGWSRFAADPTHKVAYVPQWSDWSREGTRIGISGDRLTRTLQREHDRRIVETPHTVDAPFVCASPQPPVGRFGEPEGMQRWLSIKLPAPPSRVADAVTPLDEAEVSVWAEVQRLVQERTKLPILLPDWEDVVVDQACQDERAARHLPAFLEAWKTMSLLRAFRADDGCEKETLQADFEDLAVTSLLLRGVFREGHWFPSPAKVFAEVFPVGEEKAVINPLTGKGVRYTRRDDHPVKWGSLVSDAV